MTSGVAITGGNRVKVDRNSSSLEIEDSGAGDKKWGHAEKREWALWNKMQGVWEEILETIENGERVDNAE